MRKRGDENKNAQKVHHGLIIKINEGESSLDRHEMKQNDGNTHRETLRAKEAHLRDYTRMK